MAVTLAANFSQSKPTPGASCPASDCRSATLSFTLCRDCAYPAVHDVLQGGDSAAGESSRTFSASRARLPRFKLSFGTSALAALLNVFAGPPGGLDTGALSVSGAAACGRPGGFAVCPADCRGGHLLVGGVCRKRLDWVTFVLPCTGSHTAHGWAIWRTGRHLDVSYTPLGIFVALVFIGLPFVVRTVQPVLQDLETDVEEAAASLGATRLPDFHPRSAPYPPSGCFNRVYFGLCSRFGRIRLGPFYLGQRAAQRRDCSQAHHGQIGFVRLCRSEPRLPSSCCWHRSRCCS